LVGLGETLKAKKKFKFLKDKRCSSFVVIFSVYYTEERDWFESRERGPLAAELGIKQISKQDVVPRLRDKIQ
jgi:hypothetical protein